MNGLANLLATASTFPWWSILVFIDEPKCPKSLLKKF